MTTINLAATLQATIFAQMEAAYPNEGGGFLLGTRDDSGYHVVEVVAVANTFATEEQYHRYAMRPESWAQMEDIADERGLALIGYYHSHPDSASTPSEYDRVHALPHFVYIITSVRSAQAVEMSVWLLREDRTAFDRAALLVK